MKDEPVESKEFDMYNISEAGLAYLGDAVIELLVRKKLVCSGKKMAYSVESLKYVTATSQSAAVEKILPVLKEDELTAFKRGRNNVHAAIPKSATANEYRRATGFECLFAYLYLEGMTERMNELFDIAYGC
jgi:ribonuclease-3 family protein